VGRQGLDDLEAFVWDVLERKVPGDLMETGVWQGGSCIRESHSQRRSPCGIRGLGEPVFQSVIRSLVPDAYRPTLYFDQIV
jgi:hypothetical protein